MYATANTTRTGLNSRDATHWPLWSLITLALAPALGLVTIAVERRAERRGLVSLLPRLAHALAV
jgi:hypothetical protein